MSFLSSLTNAGVERIKVNRVWREVRHGRVFWLKRRRRVATPILTAANLFFRSAGVPMQALAKPGQWQRWEVDVFLGLHGADGFSAFIDTEKTVAAEGMPGINVTEPLDSGRLTPRISAAVGRELRRVHEWYCPEFRSGWSHGDPHAGNFLYEFSTDRARIIDFEVMHRPEIPVEERHADDVLIFLQDIAGRIHLEHWLPCAEAFLLAYNEPQITYRALRQFQSPQRGAMRLWWAVRTSFLSASELRQRVQTLTTFMLKTRVEEFALG